MIQNLSSPILAIDTSCDDTAAAVVAGVSVLANVIASQTQLHQQYGGVFPTVAKQAHKENIAPVIKAALQRAGVKKEELAAVAVTQGPGLAPALEVGIKAAKDLALANNLPLIAANHVEGHVLSVLAERKSRHKKTVTITNAVRQINFPVLAMVVSGGHTEFVRIEQIGQYKIIGQTLDDAAGECLDKIGRMLNLGYPAGPIIEKFAKLGNPKAYDFPLPLTQTKDYNLSFSGLKTYARNKLEEITAQKPLTKQETYDFCASVQYAVFRHILYKLNKILENEAVKEVWLGGGVAANLELRKMIRKELRDLTKPERAKSRRQHPKIRFRAPYDKKLCMDNAAMIGVVAEFKLERGEIVANPSKLDRRPRWKIGTN